MRSRAGGTGVDPSPLTHVIAHHVFSACHTMELPEQLDVRLEDQAALELRITDRAHAALAAKEKELEQKRLDKVRAAISKVQLKLRQYQQRLADPRTKILQRKVITRQIEWVETNELRPLEDDKRDIEERMAEVDGAMPEAAGGPGRRSDESERDFLIRTGKITAFGTSTAFGLDEARSHRFLRAPGIGQNDPEAAMSTSVAPENDSITVELERGDPSVKLEELFHDEVPVQGVSRKRRASDASFSEKSHSDTSSDFEAGIDDLRDLDDDEDNNSGATDSYNEVQSLVLRNMDDGDEMYYKQRLRTWEQMRARERQQKGQFPTIPGLPEYRQPHPSVADAVLDSRFKLPGDIHPALFDYQKTCVQWLWELYSQRTGGILGDEMGLGKTVQVIAFLAGLHYLGLLDKPVLLVVPATVMNQWVNEFHSWWPAMRVVILHSIGSGMTAAGAAKTLDVLDSDLEELLDAEGDAPIPGSARALLQMAKTLVDRVVAEGHVLVTTYVGLRVYLNQLLSRQWGYAVLDEGHKIRNPNSAISLTCKRIKTHNRLILSGTPIQNNLTELWSLFDFVFPGRLGTLPVFEQQFAVPINMGGYANALNVQVQTGYKCAVILRDLIAPYMLRRLKVDVAQDLPKKNEMVLFVKLTKPQQDLYEAFLGSEDVSAILGRRRNVLMGVDTLRKICNHPDLVDRQALLRKKGYNYGSPATSGKMQVCKSLLQLWRAGGHRTLLFCQTKQMLDIMEKFVANMRVDDEHPELGNFSYLRMDGSTPIARRQLLVDSFNNNTGLDVFLLTTKVGGLGVNLTGADRVIIYDPDWNPSTDTQARERAWRLGQKRDISIYRLMTAGTIEEKIYHRQIFKTFLTNKILKDPKQKRFFKLNDLHDLFTLGDQDEQGTETGDMFQGAETRYGGLKSRSASLFTSQKPAHANADNLMEVAAMMGVSKVDKFAGETHEEEKKTHTDEDRIMGGLFAGNVHLTLKHDAVIELGPQEMSLEEKEAARIARDAALALRESRKLARRTKVGTPTWTGKFGAAGRFGKKPVETKIASSSSTEAKSADLSLGSILALLKLRKTAGGQLFGRPKKAVSEPDKAAVAERICNFLASMPDKFALLNDILAALPNSAKVKSEKDAMAVRYILREVAEWDSDKKGWKLLRQFDKSEHEE